MSQRTEPTSLITGAEVCSLLHVSDSWLSRHRDLFAPVLIPGRGRNGWEYRYPMSLVEEFIRRGQEAAAPDDDSFVGKSMREIIEIVRRQNGGTLL